MKRTFLVLIVFAVPAIAGVPVRWTVETSRLSPLQIEAYHGETLDFEATFKSYGKPLATRLQTATLYYQTNGMDSAWWTAPASISSSVVRASFTGAMDPGASSLSMFLGVGDVDGSNNIYRAHIRLRLKDSPGFLPAALELPRRTLDFSRVEVTNSPYALASDLATAPFVPLKGEGYTITPFVGGLRVTGGSLGYVDITGDGILTSGIQYFCNHISFPHLYNGYVFTGESYEYMLNGDKSKYYRILFPTPARDDTLALKSEVDALAAKIPEGVVTSNDLAAVESKIVTAPTVTNIARSVVGAVWDDALGVAWEARMHNGALYYVAVTNKPPEVVK